MRKIATELQNISDDQLQQRSLSLKYESSIRHDLKRLIPAAFALAIESARRSIGMTPYNVQILGAMQLAHGHLAEMKTGEGKTITATMPVYLHALSGRGVHVATVNDYLARRDHDLMKPVYQRLGLTLGVVQSEDTPEQRRLAYQADITYGTAKEFGFDFLRDRLQRLAMRDRPTHGALRSGDSQPVQRKLNFALVDEADSVLIDEARTPLIIGVIDSVEASIETACFRWAAQHAEQFQERVDFDYDPKLQKVELLPAGQRKTRQLPQNNSTQSVTLRRLYRYLENAIKVRRDFQLDKNYVIRDGAVAIVDEFTGRVAEGRQWQAGIHQSVEAKEQLEITPETRHGATVTLQSFFNRYQQFAGMTGTAWTSRTEFRTVYQKKVRRIPTHKPVKRKQLPTQVFTDFKRKMLAVVNEIQQTLASGRAVLVGTRSIEKSESLSRLLADRQIEHNVLNANNLARESEIVAAAGQPGRVTVATNMAGRGTDIILAESVRKAGGLHVILTELHESQRIDWQLIGRGSRQGDPGSFRIFVALDDELLRLGLGPEKSLRQISKHVEIEPLQVTEAGSGAKLNSSTKNPKPLRRETFRWFQLAQRKLERKHLVDRMILRRQDREKHERQFEMGLDPYCEVVS